MRKHTLPFTLVIVFAIIFTSSCTNNQDDFYIRNDLRSIKHEYYYQSEEHQDLFESYISGDSDKFKDIIGSNVDINDYNIAVVKFNLSAFNESFFNNDMKYLYAYSPKNSDYVKSVRVNLPFKIDDSNIGANDLIFIDTVNAFDAGGSNDFTVYIEYIVDSKSINNISSSIKIDKNTNFKDEIGYVKVQKIPKEVIELSNTIRDGISIENQGSLHEVSYAYINWILTNLYYIDDYENSAGINNNLSNSSLTLANKAGVCSDFATLLRDMFLAQGIPARTIPGAVPYKSGIIENDIDSYPTHMNVEVFDGNVWHMLDPTIFNDDSQNSITININNNKVKAYKGGKISDISNYYFIPFTQEKVYGDYLNDSYFFDISDIDFVRYIHNN